MIKETQEEERQKVCKEMNLIILPNTESRGAVFLGSLRSRPWHGAACTGGLQSLCRMQGVETGLGRSAFSLPCIRDTCERTGGLKQDQASDPDTAGQSGQCAFGSKAWASEESWQVDCCWCHHQQASGLERNGTGSKAEAICRGQSAAVSELHSSCGRANFSEIGFVPEGCDPM